MQDVKTSKCKKENIGDTFLDMNNRNIFGDTSMAKKIKVNKQMRKCQAKKLLYHV